MKNETLYSEEINGADGNYRWKAQFEYTDGYLRISQKQGEDRFDAILLSPAQVRKLIRFYELKGKPEPRTRKIKKDKKNV